MGRLAALAFALAIPILAASPRYSSAANFSADLLGEPDTRPNTWGTAGYVVWKIHFNAPPAARVRILRVYGDFVIWPKGKTPEGTTAGALFSLHTSAPESPISKVSELLVDNCFLYVQLATSGKAERAAFDNSVADGGLLGNDSTLYVKVAVWLNDTGVPIHMEPTWITVFRVEDAFGKPVEFVSPAKSRPRHAAFFAGGNDWSREHMKAKSFGWLGWGRVR